LPADRVFYLDPCPENEKVIVLLHGLGSDSSSWQLQMNVLISEGYRPIAVDLPGFGRSPFPYRHWNIRKATLLIVQQVIDKFPQPVTVMGLSLGGVVAQKVIQFRPESVDKLVLASTFARLRPRLRKNLPYLGRRILQVFSGNIRKQAAMVADHIFPLKEQKVWHDYLYVQVKNANPRIYRQAMVALAAFSSSRWMRHCHIPCLVVTGTKDTTVTIYDQNRLAKLIPEARHIFIQGGGHGVNVDHADEFNRELVQFLREN